MGKKIAIVGGGSASGTYFWPTGDEIWAVKYVTLALQAKGYKVDKSFWLDDINSAIPSWEDGTYEKLMNDWDANTELHLANLPWSGVQPYMHAFPFKEFTDTFKSDFINTSCALAFGLALLGMARGEIEEIHFHGCDFMPEPERLTTARSKELVRQSQCIAYWLGQMDARGWKYKINPISPLLETHLRNTRGFRVRGMMNKDVELLSTTHQPVFQTFKTLWKHSEILPVRTGVLYSAPAQLAKGIDFGLEGLTKFDIATLPTMDLTSKQGV